MLENEIIDFFEKYDIKKIRVEWKAGGDETILNYYYQDRILSDSKSGLLGQISMYLIEKFDLPNAGEYYNDGNGEIFIENDKVRLIYSEYAYSEDYIEDSEEELEPFNLSIIPEILTVLKNTGETSLEFDTTITFYQEKTIDFRLYKPMYEPIEYGNEGSKIEEYIRENVIPKINCKLESVEIGYSGEINETKILIEEVHVIKYYVDKDVKQKKIDLFE